MVTILADKIAIKSILDTDEYLNNFGFLPKNTLIYDKVDEEISIDTRYIFIVNYPSPPSPNGLTTTLIYGIEVVVPIKEEGDVQNAMNRILYLLNGKNIGNNHILDSYDPPQQIATTREIARYGTSFKFQTSIQFNFENVKF